MIDSVAGSQVDDAPGCGCASQAGSAAVMLGALPGEIACCQCRQDKLLQDGAFDGAFDGAEKILIKALTGCPVTKRSSNNNTSVGCSDNLMRFVRFRSCLYK